MSNGPAETNWSSNYSGDELQYEGISWESHHIVALNNLYL